MTTLTVDELRGLDRLLDLALPWFVTADDAQDLQVDTAALRGLALRGLVAFDGSYQVGADLLAELEPCANPVLIAEAEVVTSGEPTRSAVVVTTHGPATVLREMAGGLVQLDIAHEYVGDVITRLCHVDDIPERVVNREPFSTGVDAYEAADDHLLAGDVDSAVRTLVRAGVPEDGARAWATAVRGRHVAVELRVASGRGTVPAGPFEAGELRWLATDDGTVWLISATGVDADWDERPERTATVLSPVDGETLRAAVGRLVGPGEEDD